MRETGRENTTTLNDWIVPFARACSGGQRPKSFSIVSSADLQLVLRDARGLFLRCACQVAGSEEEAGLTVLACVRSWSRNAVIAFVSL